MRRFVLAAVALGAVGAVTAAAGVGTGGRAARAARGPILTPLQQRLASGTLSRALAPPATALRAPRQQANGPTADTGCPANRGANVRVNQDCQNLTDPDLAGRGEAQNETAVAQDPNNPRHLVASQNDYRRGDSSCYAAYSADGGRTWADSTIPFSFTRGDAFGGLPRQYWQAGGDPTVAWDSKGNAYQTCLLFQRGPDTSQNPDLSSAFYLFRSTGTNGASWSFPGRPVAELNDQTGEVLLDKELMAIDNRKGSPFQDRIYVTWTLFDDDGTAYIYEAYSRDYGESFSDPVLVSADSDACPDDLGVPTPQGRCNANSFSQPFTGPDGALYVVWANYNVTGQGARGEGDDEGGEGDLGANQAQPAGEDNSQQVLLAKSTDGGNHFSTPVRVSIQYELPDCETYQDATAGSACVPEKAETHNSIFRAANYPSGAVNPHNRREVLVTFGSYINRHSNERNGCVPQGFNPDTLIALYDGVKEPGACNNDIVVSASSDGGRTFTGTTTDVRRLPTATRGANDRSDQFWQWAAFDPKGRLAVSYYDRSYASDEQTGFSDISLSGTRNGSDFATVRVTTGSMPPPTEFEGGFYGDYSALSAGDVAHPVWMDTRDPELFACRDSAGQVTLPPRRCTAAADNAAVANDQNIYTASVPIPTP